VSSAPWWIIHALQEGKKYFNIIVKMSACIAVSAEYMLIVTKG